MKTWFISLNGAITLSALALLSFIGYVFLMSLYFLEAWIPGDSAAMMETIGLLLFVGGWLLALFVAIGCKWSGLIALLTFGAFTTLVALYDLPHPGPLPGQIMVFAMLISSMVSLALLSVQFRQKKVPVMHFQKE